MYFKVCNDNGVQASNIFEANELYALNYISKYVNKNDGETSLCMGAETYRTVNEAFYLKAHKAMRPADG